VVATAAGVAVVKGEKCFTGKREREGEREREREVVQPPCKVAGCLNVM
jgi:hypothetical protein